MADTKTTGVMSALKGRSGFASKKGGALLAIVAKLTAKRKSQGDTAAHEAGEPASKKAAEAKAGTD